MNAPRQTSRVLNYEMTEQDPDLSSFDFRMGCVILGICVAILTAFALYVFVGFRE